MGGRLRRDSTRSTGSDIGQRSEKTPLLQEPDVDGNAVYLSDMYDSSTSKWVMRFAKGTFYCCFSL